MAVARSAREVLLFSPVAESWGLKVADELRAAAPTGVLVHCCRSRTELLHRCAGAPASTVVLIDGSAAMDVVERPSERLIRRVRAVSGACVVSMPETPTPDVFAGATRAGATVMRPDASVEGVVGWAGPAERRRSLLDRGRALWTEQAWTDWVGRSYGIDVAPWTEPALALLAAGGERAVLAEDLLDLGVVPRRPAAVRVMRELAKALAAEEYRNTGLVAREAHAVLAGLAGARPLGWRPRDGVSLERAANALRDEPALAIAAQLTAEECADLAAICDAIRLARQRETRAVGAPSAGLGRQERRWAAGRRAAQRGADASSIDAQTDLILAQVTDTAHAILDARRDAALDAVLGRHQA